MQVVHFAEVRLEKLQKVKYVKVAAPRFYAPTGAKSIKCGRTGKKAVPGMAATHKIAYLYTPICARAHRLLSGNLLFYILKQPS